MLIQGDISGTDYHAFGKIYSVVMPRAIQDALASCKMISRTLSLCLYVSVHLVSGRKSRH